jgi:F-type H+-transporting ATPase subunit epsilon
VSTDTAKKRVGVRVLTPEGPVHSGAAYSVIAPSVMGEVGIFPRHAPLIAFLRVGETRLNLTDDTTLVLATGEGYMSVEDDQILIMVEQAENAATIDRTRAEEALRVAEEALTAAGDNENAHLAAQSAKRRAENRLRVVDKK